MVIKGSILEKDLRDLAIPRSACLFWFRQETMTCGVATANFGSERSFQLLLGDHV